MQPHKVYIEFGKGSQSERFIIVKEQWGEGPLQVITFGRTPQHHWFAKKVGRVLQSWGYSYVNLPTQRKVVYTSG